jgi:hypothetical protein
MRQSNALSEEKYNASEYFQNRNLSSFTATIVLPLSPVEKDNLDGQICQKFLRHLRHVPSENASVKILASIQYSADMLGLSDALVSKILVDYGLRAPRESFPSGFLGHIDDMLLKYSPDYLGISPSVQELAQHWMLAS